MSKKRLSEKEKDKLYKIYKVASGFYRVGWNLLVLNYILLFLLWGVVYSYTHHDLSYMLLDFLYNFRSFVQDMLDPKFQSTLFSPVVVIPFVYIITIIFSLVVKMYLQSRLGKKYIAQRKKTINENTKEKTTNRLYTFYKVGRVGFIFNAIFLGLIIFVGTILNLNIDSNPSSIDYSTSYGPTSKGWDELIFELNVFGIFVFSVIFLMLMWNSRRKLGKEYIKKRRVLEKKEYEKDLKNRNKSRKKSRDYIDDSI